MKSPLQRTTNLLYSLIFLTFLTAQTGYAQNRFCEKLADNSIEVYLGTKISVDSRYKDILTEDEFVFVNNSTKNTIDFYYNNVNVVLAPGQLSRKFNKVSGQTPKSLSDCRVKVDGIPIESYYAVNKFVDEYQGVANIINSKFIEDKSLEELKSNIALLNKTLSEINNIKNTMPAWFITAKGINGRYDQTNGWLKRLHAALGSKNNKASKTSVQDDGSESSNSSNQQSSSSTSANNIRNQSSSSGNTTTTTNAKSDEQLERERVARQLAAMEKQRIANEELQSAVTTGITTFGNQIAQSIEEKYAREERNAIRREENANKGSALLRMYEGDALKGNEEAIQQVMEGYRLLGNEEGRRVFMETMLAKHNSTAARNGLTSYYTGKMNYYKSESNSHLGLGVFTLAASGLAGYGLIHLSDQINIYEEPDREAEYDMYTYGAAGILIVGTVGSLIHFMKVGYKNNPDYIKAKHGLEGVQKKINLSYGPMIDLRNNSQGVALRINF